MTSQYQKYMQQSVNSLTAGEQINLLFDQACVNISKAIEAIENKDINGAHNSIVKTEDIFYYLIDSLDMSYPISKNLLALYDFVTDRLVQANIKKDVKPLREAQKIANELRDTWKKAEVLARTGG